MLMMRMEENLTPIMIKTWVYWTVIGLLDARIGGKQSHIGTTTHIRDIVYWQGEIIVVHWVVLTVGGKCEPWVIAIDVMFSSVYVRRNILNKYRFHLWYFPEDLWMKMNEDQLGSLYGDNYLSTLQL